MNTKLILEDDPAPAMHVKEEPPGTPQPGALSPSERHKILTAWNNTATETPHSKCIHELFEEQVARTPDQVAVVFEDQELTYRELNQRAARLAEQLRAQGVGPEVKVGICMCRSLEMMVGLYAIHKAGGAYVPLDPAYPAERLAFMLEDAQVPVLLTQKVLLPLLPNTSAKKMCLDEPVETSLNSDAPGMPPTSEAEAVKPDNLAYVIYTSGSTGKPKGVMVQHRNVVNFFTGMDLVLGRKPGVWQAITSISFDIHVLELFWTLTRGFKVVLQGDDASPKGMARPENAPGQTPKGGFSMAEQILKHRVTHLQCTPSLAAMMLDDPKTSTALAQVGTLLFGGEPLPPSLFNQLGHGQEVFNMYGPTETTVWSTVHPVTRSGGRICIGRPIANTQVYILNDAFEPVPVGVPGELWIGGAGVVRGYLNRPDLTAERFILNPFSDGQAERIYRTGDLAQYNPDGTIQFLGRADQQVKLRGFRIELGEIEAVLCEHPTVKAAVASVWQAGPQDTRLVAYVVPHPGQTCQHTSLRPFLRLQLPDYMVPAAFVSLTELPLTPNGKVDRKALPLPQAALGDGSRSTVGSPPAQAIAGVVLKTLPLTEAQREIWFGTQISDEVSASFNQSMVLNLQGDLDLPRLERAFERLVQRHEGLRVTFDPMGETQRLHATMHHEIRFEDLSGLPPAASSETLRQSLQEEEAQPFDLGNGPLMRVRILKQGPRQHVLILTLHHIICDGCSLAVLLEDLTRMYTAEENLCLGQTEMSYSQFVLSQDPAMNAIERNQAEAFWLKEFALPVPNLDLPLDRPRSPSGGFQGASCRKLLSPGLTQNVKRLSAQHRCTLMTSLLATYYLLLHRLSGQADIVVGLPMTRRAGIGSERLVGHCVNFLPLRSRVDGRLSFTQHLAQMWQLMMRAHEHQNFTLGSLLQKLNLNRDKGRMPLTSVMFNLDWVQEPLTMLGLKVEAHPNPACHVRFDLNLSVSERDGQLELFVQYSSELLEPSTIERWLGHYETLLEAVAANPSLRISDLPRLCGPDGTPEVRPAATLPLQVDGVIKGEVPVVERSAAPLNSVEETLAQIWREVILLDEVGRHDNFFDIGGHSLLATKVIARITKAFQVELPVRTVFESPTIAELAQAVSVARAAQPASPTISIRRNHLPAADALRKRLEKLSEAELRALLGNSKKNDLV